MSFSLRALRQGVRRVHAIHPRQQGLRRGVLRVPATRSFSGWSNILAINKLSYVSGWFSSEKPVPAPPVATVETLPSEVTNVFVEPTELISNTSEIATAAAEVAEVATEAASAHWYNVQLVMNCMEWVHVNTGIPWWATIIMVTASIRGCMVPLVIRQFRVTAKLAQMKPEMTYLTDEYNRKRAMDPDGKTAAAEHQQNLNELFKRYGASPFHAMVMPAVSAPVFMTFFFSLRGMAEEVTSFASGGALWFPDLSAQDPMYALPIISSITFLGVIQRGSDGGNPDDEKQKFMLMGMRGLACVMPVLTYQFPSGVFLYWITSNVVSLTQGEVMKMDALRTRLSLPTMGELKEIQKRSENPYIPPANKKEDAKEQKAKIKYYEAPKAETADKPKKKKPKKKTRR